MRQLLFRENAEHVGLIFCPGARPMQFSPSRRVEQGRIVSGRDRFEPQSYGLVKQSLEFDLFIAAEARVRSATGGILGNKIVDDIFLESLTKIPHVKGNAEEIRGAPGIHRVFDRAATTGSGAECSGHTAERKMHPNNFVTGLNRTSRCDRRVHSPTHRSQNLHPGSLSGVGGINSPAVRISAPNPRIPEFRRLNSTLLGARAPPRRDARRATHQPPLRWSRDPG